jgi:hypothetical protein
VYQQQQQEQQEQQEQEQEQDAENPFLDPPFSRIKTDLSAFLRITDGIKDAKNASGNGP